MHCSIDSVQQLWGISKIILAFLVWKQAQRGRMAYSPCPCPIMLCKSDLRTNASCKITEPGSGDPIVSTSAPKGSWQGMCLSGVGTRKGVRPRETWRAPIVETGIRQRDLISGKRQSSWYWNWVTKAQADLQKGLVSWVWSKSWPVVLGRIKAWRLQMQSFCWGCRHVHLVLCPCAKCAGDQLRFCKRKALCFCLFSLIYIFYWSIVDLQCFRCTAGWFSYTHAHIYMFLF